MAADLDIYNTVIADGLPPALALLIVAQSKFETQNYTSPVFTDCNNAFGFGYPNGDCSGHPYTGYDNVIDSTHDLTAWINQNFSASEIAACTTPAIYAQTLSNHKYYTDTVANYTAGLQQYYSAQVPGAATSSYGGSVTPYNYTLIIAAGILLLLYSKQIFKK